MAADEDCGGNANEVAGPENGPPEAGKGLEEAARQKWPCLLVSLFFFHVVHKLTTRCRDNLQMATGKWRGGKFKC